MGNTESPVKFTGTVLLETDQLSYIVFFSTAWDKILSPKNNTTEKKIGESLQLQYTKWQDKKSDSQSRESRYQNYHLEVSF